MKKSLPFFALGILVLIAIVVLVGRVGQSGEEEGNVGLQGSNLRKGSVTGQQGETSRKTDRVREVSEEETAEVIPSEAAKLQMERMNRSIGSRNEKKAEALIAKLVKELGLTPEQALELENYYAAQVSSVNDLFAGEIDLDDPLASTRALAALDGKGLDEVMSELLDDEQQEKWEEHEEKRVHRTADSGALQQLASLGAAVEISEDQREELYEHFYQERLEKENTESPQNTLSTTFEGITSSLGIDFGFGSIVDTDFQALAQEMGNDGGEIDPGLLIQKQRELNIESKVNQLAPFLDETQLDDYRAQLQSEGSILDGFIGEGALEGINASTPAP